MARDTTTPSAGPGGALISASRRGREQSVPCLPSQLDIEREANGLGRKQPVLLDGYYILRHTQEEGRMSGQEPVVSLIGVCVPVCAPSVACASLCVWSVLLSVLFLGSSVSLLPCLFHGLKMVLFASSTLVRL